MIVNAKQAEAIVAEGKADMIAMARAFLDDPHWAWHAAQILGAEVARPPQYQRVGPALWPGAALRGCLCPGDLVDEDEVGSCRHIRVGHADALRSLADIIEGWHRDILVTICGEC